MNPSIPKPATATLCAALFVTLLSPALAESAKKLGAFVPFPGSWPAALIAVEASNQIRLKTNIWDQDRTFLVSLPGLVVPSNRPGTPACERALAAAGKAFAEKYLRSAEKIELSELKMMSSVATEASSPIVTDQGNLADALVQAGYARRQGAADGASWCQPQAAN